MVVKRLVLEATVEKKLVEVALVRVVPACAVRLPEIVTAPANVEVARVEVAVRYGPVSEV